MSKNKNRRRAQAQKRVIDKVGHAEVERARSNAAGPHRPKKAYVRKSKYGKGWE
jgi:hypothetical protein